MANVSLENLSKSFGHTRAVDALSLEVAEGELFVLLGPSGAGKTTTLRLVAGLEQPESGRVTMGGRDVTAWHPADRDVAFVFQTYSLYPHLSVFDNLAFPLRSPLRRTSEEDVKRRVRQVAELLHIEAKLANKATQLSGGEMQRVALGRALVRQPQVFLMDEPLSSLDAKLREELRGEIKRTQRSLNATVFYVTHDQVEATTLADRIGILEGGRLVQVGTPQEIYEDPSTLPAALRLGSPRINLVPASWFPGGLPGGTTDVAIRPEYLRLLGNGATPGPSDESFSFRVVECSLLRHELAIEREGVTLFAKLTVEEPFPIGAEVRVAVPAEHRLHFDAAGRRVGEGAPR